MASVFLSYAREDLKRARTVAGALKKAGHDVWWDRHLAGGSEYSQEIASALNDADVVVVLWSRASVASAWVRDEAAKGRDSGRLVPASLDGTEPPLGFGQHHTIDLSRRGSMRELVDAVRRKRVAEDKQALLESESSARLAKGTAFRPALIVAALAALLAIGFVGWRLMGPGSTADRELALAVMPFADMSPGRDQSHLGEGIAEEIMTLVSGTPDLRVLGRTSAWRLNDQGLEAVREKLGATHLLEGSVRAAGEELRIAARLIATDSGEELWSEEFRRPLSAIFAVQEEIGASVAQRLRGTVAAAREGGKARSIRTSPEVYDLYLAARAVGRRRDYESQLQAEQLLEQALAVDPDYAPAHAYLAITLRIQDNQDPAGADQNRPERIGRGLAHAKRAIELAPGHAESHIALGMIVRDNPSVAIAALDRGKQLDPDNFFAWNISGVTLNRMCRYEQAADNFRRAAQIEPLLHVPHANLLDSLLRSGRTAEAEQLIERFAARRADPPRAQELRGEYLYATGNLAESFRQFQAAAQAGLNSPSAKLHQGQLLLRFGQVDEGVATLPEVHQRLVGAYWRGDYGAAAAEVEAMGISIWNIPDLPAAWAKAMVHAGRNDELLRLTETRWGSIGKLIRDPSCRFHELGPTFVVALRESGRNREAQALLEATKAEYRHRVRNGVAGAEKSVQLAAIHGLEGRIDQAIAELERAASMGWVDQNGPYGIALDDPAFIPLRSHPRFQALSKRIAEKIAAEAAKVEKELAAAATPN